MDEPIKVNGLIDVKDFIYLPRFIIGIIAVVVPQMLLLVSAIVHESTVILWALVLMSLLIAVFMYIIILIFDGGDNNVDNITMCLTMASPVINIIVLTIIFFQMNEEEDHVFDLISWKLYAMYMLGTPLYFAEIPSDDHVTSKMALYYKDDIDEIGIFITPSKKIYATVLLKYSKTECRGTTLG